MAEFFKTSRTWVVDYRYNGRPRTIFKVIEEGQDAQALVADQLRELHGTRAALVSVRLATDEEERAYLRGEEPRNVFCPTGVGPRTHGEPLG